MANLKLTTILTASALLLFVTDAYAADRTEDNPLVIPVNTMDMPEKPTLNPEPTEAKARNMDTLPEADITKIYVRAPIDPDRFVPVTAPDGTTYYNRTILAKDLKKVADDLRVVDRYVIRHDGTRYVNTVVVPKDEQ